MAGKARWVCYLRAVVLMLGRAEGCHLAPGGDVVPSGPQGVDSSTTCSMVVPGCCPAFSGLCSLDLVGLPAALPCQGSDGSRKWLSRVQVCELLGDLTLCCLCLRDKCAGPEAAADPCERNPSPDPRGSPELPPTPTAPHSQ